ncbi:DNA repair protein RadC [Caulobacter sp. 17J65-9]|uniref:RadC family protein n=1 Tax=Caulobacter sp. 17J65-9 TaxID=2709382 RepID=UPI0013CD11E4|nr:DNA repair protein RadC [Caulobacter sp. 17J65-9]NEX94079.1 JAB domain-containing protein [Caulobacter sp. 17J65-9]
MVGRAAAPFELVASPPSPPTHAQSTAGHRERLRARAHAAGLESLPDYELLELFLFRSIPQRDVKPLAKALLGRFGSLAAALAAPIEALTTVSALDAKGKVLKIGPETALDLRALHDVARRVAAEPVRKRTVISSWTALLAYLRVALAHETREQFRVIYLDKKNQLIADEVMLRGTIDHAAVYPREVARRTLELSAASLILVHNHPSGDPTPSRADADMTRMIVDAMRVLGVSVHDHLVVGRDGVASLKALGLM